MSTRKSFFFKKINLVLWLTLITSVALTTVTPAQATSIKVIPLHVITEHQAVYQCGKTKVKASFYHLSDNSLHFVKISNGKTKYTLPQLVSASGARYTDEHSALFWVKGESAYFSTDLTTDNTIDCQVISAK